MSGKILLIVSTLDTGGAQKVAAEISNMLDKHYEVEFLLNERDSVAFPHGGVVRTLGFRKEKNRTKIIYQTRVFLKRVVVLRKLKASNDYKAVISFLDSANVANILSGKKNTKIIVTIHSTLSQRRYDWKYRFIVIPLVSMIYGFADEVVAVSKGVENDLRYTLGYSKDNLRTIYNGFDTKEIRRRSNDSLTIEERSILNGSPIIISIGRLIPSKAQWHLIRAFPKVVEKYEDVRLLIVGDGELMTTLVELAEKIGMGERIFFTGFTDNPYRLLKRADVFVMTSTYEGLPTSMIEALIVGVPVVSTDFRSGAREILAPEVLKGQEKTDRIIKGNYGILTPLCDGVMRDSNDPLTPEEEMLAEGIKMMLECGSDYSGRFSEATERFEKDTIAREWISLIG